MTGFDDLVAEYCPNGVRFARLGDVCAFNRGKWMKADSLQPGSVPVVTSSRTISAYHSTSNRKGTTVVVASSGAYAGYVSIWKEPIYLSNAFSVDVKDSSVLSPEFVYLCLQSMQDRLHGLAAGAGVPNIYGSDIASIKIPVPPVEVQEEVVRILGLFTKLEAELEAELEARRLQFEFYRSSALTFSSQAVPRIALGELADLNWGDTNTTKSSYVPASHGYPAYSASGQDGYLDHFDFDRPAVVLSAIGALAGRTWRASGKWSCIKNTMRFFSRDESRVSTDYLYWVTSSPGFWPRRGSAQPFIAKGDADKILIPVPASEQQERIVCMLDSFAALMQEASASLPAEIAARRKQYEYYRERLLTFKELDS